jgi:hypothetical protein
MPPATSPSVIATAAKAVGLPLEPVALVADGAAQRGHPGEHEQLVSDLEHDPELGESILAWLRAWAAVAEIGLPEPRTTAEYQDWEDEATK